MRAQFKTPHMPFIIARVRPHYGGKTGQATLVRDAQGKVADSSQSIGWFDTDDCELRNKGHYNAVGLVTIGKRFADAYEALSPSSSQHVYEQRTWRSQKGSVIEAKLVKNLYGRVTLKQADGKEVTILESHLSAEDRQYLSDMKN